MGDDLAKIAVLLPVFNDQAGLDRSLESLAVEAPPFKVYVVDDGSIVPMKAPVKLQNGVEVEIIRLETNSGIEVALNAGLSVIANVGHVYVARLDAGDWSLPGRLKLQSTVLDSEVDCAFLGCAAEFVDAEGATLFVQRGPRDSRSLHRLIYLNNPFCHPTVMFRMSALNASGFYATSFPGAEDYELFWRLMRGASAKILNEVLVRTVANPAGLSRSRRRLQLRSRLRIQLRYFELGSFESYLGVAQTLALWWVPWRILDQLKALKSRAMRRFPLET